MVGLFDPDRAARPAHPSAEPEHQSCGGRIGKESAAAPTGAAGPLHRLQCGGSRQAEQSAQLAKERRIQETLLTIKQKYGKNAILRGLNFEEGATAVERNKQIGGHKA